MKQLNYKIKKGHVSYLWRGEGKRWYKARFKTSWFVDMSVYIKYMKFKNGNFYGNVNGLKK
ncbi:hypothetical protein UFOVP208_53 [uncultured Caudovirales phage]|uniref:Uncharacterized protein n=1 Tax=uncultured Caudovirales phage TaxID=2100421 RepID=A0A6J7WJ33_9CAUD|nr:hypothetical protein UFOVP208_53 [uncultured Caudovirales phage]